MDRRDFIRVCGVGAALSLAGCAQQQQPVASTPPPPRAFPSAPPGPKTIALPAPVANKVPLPGGGIYDLPGEGSCMAWTVDDGASEETIRKYGEFAAATGTRLTFFVNGTYEGWANQAKLLKPMVKSGQIQIANHTWSHPSLTSLSDQGIIDELIRNDEFITTTFGMSSQPFYRPPFGYRNDHTDAVAASVGFTAPVMWYGSLGDAGKRTEQQIVEAADQWFGNQRIVIGHANFPEVTAVFPQLLDFIKSRGLVTVTLNDYFIV